MADLDAGWSAGTAKVLKELVRSTGKCLCHQSPRKRIGLAQVLETLVALADESRGTVRVPGAAGVSAGASGGVSYVPTPLSVQVRGLRQGDRGESLKQNMLLAFDSLIAQLDGVYDASKASAPARFEERINYWHTACGMDMGLTSDMHKLRIWANAARHQDEHRWRRDGPHTAEDASCHVTAIEAAIAALP